MALMPLNSSDQFTLVMDNEIRRSGLCGNYCALILELSSNPDKEKTQNLCKAFAEKFPVAVARLQQNKRKFFWQTPLNEQAVPYTVIQLASDREIKSELIGLMNRNSDANKSPPFELYYLGDESGGSLVLKWFHPAMDAKGAELVLHHLFSGSDKAQSDATLTSHSRPTFRSLWKKLRLIFKAKGNIRALDLSESILPTVYKNEPLRVGFEKFTFAQEQTKNIMVLARKNAGLTGTSLYLIGCAMRALAICDPNAGGDAYCVPYAVNLRKRRSLFPVFGNQVTFLFSQVPRGIVGDRESLFKHLREQNKKAIKRGLDNAMIPLMEAGSWLSLEKYGSIVRFTDKGRERSSFWFSFTGDIEPPLKEVSGANVEGVSQFTQVSSPPGLSVLANTFQGRLTISINYVVEQFSPAWIEKFMTTLCNELEGANDPG